MQGSRLVVTLVTLPSLGLERQIASGGMRSNAVPFIYIFMRQLHYGGSTLMIPDLHLSQIRSAISGDTRPHGSSALGRSDGERGQLSQEPQQL